MQSNKSSYKFQGLDRPKETVTLRAVFLFVFFLFAMIVGTMFFLRYSAYSSFSDYYRGQSLNLPAKTPLKQEGSITLFFSESQLANLWQINSASFPLKNPNLKINEGSVEVSGKTSTHFWGLPVSVLLVPGIENGQIVFRITKMSAYGVGVPDRISSSVSKTLLDNTSKISLLPNGNNKIKSITATSGQLFVTFEHH